MYIVLKRSSFSRDELLQRQLYCSTKLGQIFNIKNQNGAAFLGLARATKFRH